MPKFAANLTMLFNEQPFLERFGAAARNGFKGVEFLFPYEFEPQQIHEQLDTHKLEMVLHNLPAGNWKPSASTAWSASSRKAWPMPMPAPRW
jgi:hydroxypyruvate isomerase